MLSGGGARERLLQAASELFYADGLTATGIDSITARAGVAKMSLYNNFSSKADLVTAYLERRCEDWHELLNARLDRTATPHERILAVFDSYVDHATAAAGGFRGCGLFNAAAELPIGDMARAVVAAQKDEVEQFFEECLVDMHLEPSSVSEMAQHLSFLLEGAMSRAGLEGHERQLKVARRIAASMLERLRNERDDG